MQETKICGTVTLPAVLYECETRSLVLGEERRPRALKNKLLRKIPGLERNELTGE